MKSGWGWMEKGPRGGRGRKGRGKEEVQLLDLPSDSVSVEAEEVLAGT